MTQLGISQQEHDGLVMIAEQLRRPSTCHEPSITSEQALGVEDSASTHSVMFNMAFSASPLTSEAAETYHCGTVACIGGHLSLHLQGVSVFNETALVCLTKEHRIEANAYVASRDRPLYDLFFPKGVEYWNRITPFQAAQAINNFLTSGDPDWREVVDVDNRYPEEYYNVY